jgi:hypothetical protein
VIIPAAKNRISPFSTQSTELLSIKTVKVLLMFNYNIEIQQYPMVIFMIPEITGFFSGSIPGNLNPWGE